MAAHGDSERLIKDLVLQLMTMVDKEAKAARTAATDCRPPALDPELLMAARRDDDGNRLIKKLLKPADVEAGTAHVLDGVTPEGDSLLHVVAAAGDGTNYLDRAEVIVHNGNKHLLVARNNKGDTPLHCAAAAGNATMLSRLIDLKEGKGGETAAEEFVFVRTRNRSGETALHRAVRAADKDCIERLMKADPELACFPNQGTSPLYLAISLGDMETAHHLFLVAKMDETSYSGPDGRNVLHAAVSRGQALPELLEWFKPVNEDGTSLLPDLTTQRDKDGSTPLHLAASLEGWPLATDLSKWFPHVWPQSKSTIQQLLGINQCAAYQPDKEGLYPIHVAASVGSLESVKTLLEICPECATLCDGKGRTFLHVAVEKEMQKVVKYICRMSKFSSVLNMQDNNGDTALHRAIDVGDLAVFNYLIRNPHVRLNIPNKDELTPLDLSRSKILAKFYFSWNPRSAIHSTLQYVGAPCGSSRADIFYQKYVPKRNEKEESENLSNATQVMGITSVLVASMAFAGAFTFPGGYYQSANDGVLGAPVLGGSYAFDAFFIANALTFVCSCVATFSLIFSGLPSMDLSLRYKYFHRSLDFVEFSVRSLSATFLMGVYLVLAPFSRTFTILEFVVFFLSLLYAQVPASVVIRVANTARIRSAIDKKTAPVHLRRFLKSALLPCWSFVCIFGVPLVIRLIKVHHTH